jgi:hypothetical protein
MTDAISKTTCAQVTAAARIALEDVAKRYGLTVQVGGGSYDELSFRPKVEFKVADADRAEFERFAKLVGLEPSDFGATFSSNGNTFTVAGINLRASRFPVNVRRADGKMFKMPEATVAKRLKEGRTA